jgi:hypothetical protein
LLATRCLFASAGVEVARRVGKIAASHKVMHGASVTPNYAQQFDKATKFKVYDSPTSDLRSTFPLRPHQPSCFKRQGTGKYLKSQQPEPPSFCNQQPPCLNERFSRSTTPQTSTPLRSYALAPQSKQVPKSRLFV